MIIQMLVDFFIPVSVHCVRVSCNLEYVKQGKMPQQT